MDVNDQVKSFLSEKHGLPADATDNEAKALLIKLFTAGELDKAQLTELTADPDAQRKAAEDARIEKEVASRLDAALADVLKFTGGEQKATKEVHHVVTAEASDVEKALSTETKESHQDIHVKGVWERYETTTKSCSFPQTLADGQRHPMAGQPMKEDGREVRESSELTDAIAGVSIKNTLNIKHGGAVPSHLRMTENDYELLEHGYRTQKWVGQHNGNFVEGFVPGEKFLSYASGDAACLIPEQFDSGLIQKPYMESQILPCVDMKIARGNKVKYGEAGQVVWNHRQACEPCKDFNCDDLFSCQTVEIKDYCGTVKYCNTFESDANLSLAQFFRSQFSQALLEELDRLIMLGDGAITQLGIANTPGKVNVLSPSGIAGLAKPTPEDLGELCYSIDKRNKGTNPRCWMYAGNQDTYARFRTNFSGNCCPQDYLDAPISDGGLNGKQYACIDDIPDGELWYFDASRYRMYRRQGFTMRSTREGEELCKADMTVLCFSYRAGGRHTCPGAIACMTGLPV